MLVCPPVLCAGLLCEFVVCCVHGFGSFLEPNVSSDAVWTKFTAALRFQNPFVCVSTINCGVWSRDRLVELGTYYLAGCLLPRNACQASSTTSLSAQWQSKVVLIQANTGFTNSWLKRSHDLTGISLYYINQHHRFKTTETKIKHVWHWRRKGMELCKPATYNHHILYHLWFGCILQLQANIPNTVCPTLARATHDVYCANGPQANVKQPCKHQWYTDKRGRAVPALLQLWQRSLSLSSTDNNPQVQFSIAGLPRRLATVAMILPAYRPHIYSGRQHCKYVLHLWCVWGRLLL